MLSSSGRVNWGGYPYACIELSAYLETWQGAETSRRTRMPSTCVQSCSKHPNAARSQQQRVARVAAIVFVCSMIAVAAYSHCTGCHTRVFKHNAVARRPGTTGFGLLPVSQRSVDIFASGTQQAQVEAGNCLLQTFLSCATTLRMSSSSFKQVQSIAHVL
ncbi:hypothetical protein ABBQ32_008526 [Trebouxia sp. C0010 RCD-2024]